MRFRLLGRIAATVAALALAGSSALAADPAKPPEKVASAAPASTKADRKTLRCVSETPTGTFITKRVCYSEADWAELQRLADESRQREQDQRTFCTRGGREC